MELFVIREYGNLKLGDICECTEEMWISDHPSVLVTKPDGSEFWYYKYMFKTMIDIRDSKLNDILDDL